MVTIALQLEPANILLTQARSLRSHGFTHAVECEDQAKVAGKGESQPSSIQSDPGGGQSPWGEKPEDGQLPLCEWSGWGEDNGELKEDDAVIEGSQTGQSELSIAVLFDELDVD